MRKIYLVRHGLPDFPGGERLYLGHTDLPISATGRMQALLAAKFFKEFDISTVFCSKLIRAVQTAKLFGNAKIVEGLEEMNFGEWDGLSFKEISERWPDLYAAWSLDNSLQPPDAETPGNALTRFDSAFRNILERSTGDIIIVSHASIMRTFLCRIAGEELPTERELLPYGSISKLSFKNNFLTIEYMGAMHRPPLSEELCLDLLYAAETPKHIITHSVAVSAEAAKIGKALSKCGVVLDMDLIVNGALLHDIARTQKEHCKTGQEWLEALGYLREAKVIGAHNSDSVFDIPSEAAVVTAADRTVSEDEVVGLHEKFKRSAVRCHGEEAKKAHARRLTAAEKNAETINRICGWNVVKIY